MADEVGVRPYSAPMFICVIVGHLLFSLHEAVMGVGSESLAGQRTLRTYCTISCIVKWLGLIQFSWFWKVWGKNLHIKNNTSRSKSRYKTSELAKN